MNLGTVKETRIHYDLVRVRESLPDRTALSSVPSTPNIERREIESPDVRSVASFSHTPPTISGVERFNHPSPKVREAEKLIHKAPGTPTIGRTVHAMPQMPNLQYTPVAASPSTPNLHTTSHDRPEVTAIPDNAPTTAPHHEPPGHADHGTPATPALQSPAYGAPLFPPNPMTFGGIRHQPYMFE